jgi:hypothetical protein
MATGSYVGKSKLYRARSAAHTKRGGTGKAIFYNNYSHNLEPSTTVESNIKVYIPKEYFKHTGYIKDEESAAATGDAKSRTSMKSRQMPRKPQTPFKERFNEKLEYPNAPSQKSGSKVINQGPRLRHVGPGANGDDSISVLSRVISQVDDFKSKASASDLMSAHTGASGRSRPQTASMMKRKILDRINQLDEKQLEQMEKELEVKTDDIKAYANGSISNEDKASIITQDRLKKFNEIYGYENGPATRIDEGQEEGEEFDQELGVDDQSNPNEGYEEQKDEVHPLKDIARGQAKRLAKIKPKLHRSGPQSKPPTGAPQSDA